MSRIEAVTSAGNATLKRVRKLLSSRKERREQTSLVVEGVRAVEMLLDHSQDRMAIETMIVSESFSASSNGQRILEKTGDLRIVGIPDDLMDRVGDVRASQGVLAVVSVVSPASVEIPERGIFLLLDSIADPGNMGTLIRTAVGVGLDGVLFYGDCVDVYNPKSTRSTAGTLPFIPLSEAGLSDLDRFLAAGYELYATRMAASQSVFEADFGERLLIAVGNEAHGLSPEILRRATREIAIPLQEPCESLNAAIAGSIVAAVASHSRARTGD